LCVFCRAGESRAHSEGGYGFSAENLKPKTVMATLCLQRGSSCKRNGLGLLIN
jgi:hypothetical protein